MADGKLTALKIKSLTKPGHHGDGGGLYLRIAEGRRSWMFRFKIKGRTTWLGLGPEGDVGLSQAREAARLCREQLRKGINPLDARRAAVAQREEAEAHTFQAVAEQYIAAHKAGWRNAKHAEQWGNSLAKFAYGKIGGRPVSEVGVADVLGVLEPIWLVLPETASRVRGRIENILDYARARHWRSGENPARWRGNLDHLLPARAKIAAVEHHAAPPWQDLPSIMAELAKSSGTSALCLQFLILTAARSGEARGATWGEIDVAAKIWTIPKNRMKGGREHRVPLSAPALAILEHMAGLGADPGRVVFEGGKKGKPLSDVALSKALAAAGGADFTVHGLRSTFRDWCAARTSYPREIAEAALAHVNKDRVEAAYLRGDHFEKRARIMAEWAKYATSPAQAGAFATIGRVRA